MKKILLSLVLWPSIAGAYSLNLPIQRPFLIAQAPDPATLPPSLATLSGTATTDTSIVDGTKLFALWHINDNYAAQFDRSLSVTFCGARELHDGQFLTGSCRDLLLLTSKESDGLTHKLAHIGMGVLTNAEHLNASYILKGGLDLGGSIEHVLGWAGVAYPHLAKLGAPPWVQKLGDMTSIDGFWGKRPVHTSDVIGETVYGVAFNVTKAFDLGSN